MNWWEISLGVVFIIVGFACFLLINKSKKSVEKYKKRQLEELKKIDKKFKGDYKESKLLLPWSQKIKLTFWPTLGLCLIILGIFFIFGFKFNFFIR